MNITNIHHISIMSGHAQQTIDFHTSVLGLRLVKQTVNYDNPKMYHLYFGNNTGQDGTLITFFPQEITVPVVKSDNNNSTTIFRVPNGTLPYWQNRLKSFGIKTTKRQRYNKIFLAFSDMHNVKYELVEDDKGIDNNVLSSDVSEVNAIKGIYGVIINSRNSEKTKEFLINELNLIVTNENHIYYQFTIKGEFNTYIELNKENVAVNRNNTGNIHHVAFSINERLQDWKRKLNKTDHYSSKILDRTYFDSIYFNEPGGNLFELAVNKNSFTYDEKIEELGNSLVIPAHFVDQSEEIANKLMPLFNQKVDELGNYPYNNRETYDVQVNHQIMLKRINELAAKNKTKEGLTNEEVEERAILRKKYVQNIVTGFSNTMDNVRIVDEDGNESKLKKK